MGEAPLLVVAGRSIERCMGIAFQRVAQLPAELRAPPRMPQNQELVIRGAELTRRRQQVIWHHGVLKRVKRLDVPFLPPDAFSFTDFSSRECCSRVF